MRILTPSSLRRLLSLAVVWLAELAVEQRSRVKWFRVRFLLSENAAPRKADLPSTHDSLDSQLVLHQD